MKDVNFKPVENDVLFVDAPSYDDLMPRGSLARMVDEFVNSVVPEDVKSAYSRQGQNGYSPYGMLKAILFAYAVNVYSCREIYTLLGHDLIASYFLGYARPGYNTINSFRARRLGNGYVNDIFRQFATMLLDRGLIDVVKVNIGRGSSRESRLMILWRSRPRKIARTKKERKANADIANRLVKQIAAAVMN